MRSAIPYSKVRSFQKKDYNLAKHPEIDVPNLQMINLMQSFKSMQFVRETFVCMHYYWYLTNDGIEYLRTFLRYSHMRLSSRPFVSGPAGDSPREPPRFEGNRPKFGDMDGYRGGDKTGASPEFQPSFMI